VRMVMDYLQRKYGLDPVFNAAITPIGIKAKGGDDDPREILSERRIAYPNQLVRNLSKGITDPVGVMDLEAINCDHISLPKDYDTIVAANLNRGGYYLTHVVFALQRMHENGCNFFSKQQDTALREQAAQGMFIIINDPATTPDLRSESVAFLLDMGRRDLVQPTWITQIASEQLPNGGWQSGGNDPDADHATILALWSLLQYTYPNAPNEPMIRRPGDIKYLPSTDKPTLPKNVVPT